MKTVLLMLLIFPFTQIYASEHNFDKIILQPHDERATFGLAIEMDLTDELQKYDVLGIKEKHRNSKGSIVRKRVIKLSTVNIEIDTAGIVAGVSGTGRQPFTISNIKGKRLNSICGTYDGYSVGFRVVRGPTYMNLTNNEGVKISGFLEGAGVAIEAARSMIYIICPLNNESFERFVN
jgi:hypothetical protein